MTVKTMRMAIFCQTIMMVGLVSVAPADPVKKAIPVFSKGDRWMLSVKGVMCPMSPLKQKKIAGKMKYISKWRGGNVTLSIKAKTKRPVVMSILRQDKTRLDCDGFLPQRNKHIIRGFCKDPKGEQSSWLAYRENSLNAEKEALKKTKINTQTFIEQGIEEGKSDCAPKKHPPESSADSKSASELLGELGEITGDLIDSVAEKIKKMFKELF